MTFKNILNGQSKTITSAAIIIAVASLASRILGIFRDRILAAEFGAGDTLDVYYAAFRIPDLVFNLLVLGALSAGFIPVLTGYLSEEKREKAWQLVNSVLNIVLVFLMVVCAILVIFTPWIMPLIAPGFDAEKIKMTINLTRLMFLSPLFLGISGVFGGVLQSFRSFFVYSLAPIIYNIGIIIGALFLVPIWGIYGLAVGVVIGAFGHMAIQIPTARNFGYRYKWMWNFKNRDIKEIGRMMLPRTLSLAVVQINLLVVTIIASTLASGSISIFNLANNLQSFPVGIFGISFAIAAFPTISLAISRRDKGEFIKSFSNTFRQVLFFIIPISVLFIILRAQIVRVVLGAGQFTWEDTVLTADSLGLFCLSLFAQSLIPLLARSFYALKNTSVPFLAGLIGAVTNLILSLMLIKSLDILGLALAFSVSSILNMMILWVALRIKFGYLNEFAILGSILKISFASLIMGVVVQTMKYTIAPLVNMDKFWGIFTQGLLSGLMGLIVFVLISLVLKSEEMIVFVKSIKKRLFKTAELPNTSIREGEH